MLQLQRACSAAGILEASGALQQAIGSLAHVRGGSTTNLCLRCGKPGASRLCGNGCSVAKFCGPECERAALPSHRGATFCPDSPAMSSRYIACDQAMVSPQVLAGMSTVVSNLIVAGKPDCGVPHVAVLHICTGWRFGTLTIRRRRLSRVL